MKIEMKPLAEVRPYENNPRLNDGAVEAVVESIRQFGFRQPIVIDGEGVIVCGHTRFKAATKMGLAEVPVHVATDLTPEQVRAYRIADNKTGELATWDMDLLPVELAELQGAGLDWSLLGFDDRQLQALLDTGVQDGLTDPDAVPEPPDEPVTQRGDLWVLGDHRLLCGDSSSPEDVQRLLEGESVQLVNMDPPYNVGVQPRSNNAFAAGRKGLPSPTQSKQLGDGSAKITKMRPKDRPLENDFMSGEAFDRMLAAWFGNAADALEPGCAFYIWGGAFPPDIDSQANTETFPASLRAAGLAYAHLIIWDKGYGVIGRKDFMTQFEVCFYGWKRGAPHAFLGPNNITDLWQVKKVNPQAMVHLTEKPVELAVRAMQYSSRPDERVLDLFGGSGSTLIAAEQTGRRAMLMEIDPAYCDVIVQRWEEFTGKKAQRENAPAEAKA